MKKNNIGNVSKQNYRTNQKSNIEDWEFGTHGAYMVTTCRDWRTCVSGLSLQTRVEPSNSCRVSCSTFTIEPMNQPTTEDRRTCIASHAWPSQPNRSNSSWMKYRERLGDRAEWNKWRSKRDRECYPKHNSSFFSRCTNGEYRPIFFHK